ncbi:TolC family protein [Arenibacter sp. GZD96]|uniref:TolC family protein n=1 Tax=Aurantibrevibacter litoralis TaxID=3106030 RepID=UPI002AFFC5A2|nr:TolC family protein [Arenibacter sp. GZD-96]MEA1785473.1 TolC family protein [Arenibacter sp. GZD-96]
MKKQVIFIIFICIGFGVKAQSLTEFFELAAEDNPGLQAQYKEFKASLEKVAQANSLPDPSLTVSAFGQMVETRVGPQKARFSLSQMFPWFGTLKVQGDVAALMAASKYQIYIEAKNKLRYDLAVAYFPLLELREQLSIEEKNVDLLHTYKNIANSKFANSSGSLVDVLRIDLLLKEAEKNLEILKKREIPLLVSLNTMLNRDPKQTILLSEMPGLQELPTIDQKDSVLTDHPLLSALELKLEASRAEERLAVKQGLPKIGVGVDFISVGQREDLAVGATPPSDNGKDVIMPMLTFSLPVFRGKYKAALKEAQLRQESFSLQRTEIANNLRATYEMAQYELERQADLVALFTQLTEQSDQVLYLLYKTYSNSGSDLEEVLRMQQQRLRYEKQKIGALAQYQIALAKLDYITAKNNRNE